MGETKHTPGLMTFMVIRDHGYGRVTSRVGYETEADAQSAMHKWQREGIATPGMIGGGDWSIVPALSTVSENGGKFYTPIRATLAEAEGRRHA